MIAIDIKYKPIARIPFNRLLKTSIPENISECKPKHLIALAGIEKPVDF